MKLIFVIHALTEQGAADNLQKQFAPHKMAGMATCLTMREVDPSYSLGGDFQRTLTAADAVVLALSPDLLCIPHMGDVMKFICSGQMNTIPIILKRVAYTKLPCADMRPLPLQGGAVADSDNPDRLFYEAAEAIYQNIIQE